MNPKMIPLDLRLKGISVDAIHDNLVHTLGADAAIDIRVTKEARSVNFDPTKERLLFQAGRSAVNDAF
jgi:hypothetical protein